MRAALMEKGFGLTGRVGKREDNPWILDWVKIEGLRVVTVRESMVVIVVREGGRRWF